MMPIKVLYNKLDSPSLMPWIESIALVERSGGKASTLTLKLCNRDGRFLGSWGATRGDSVAVEIPPASADPYAIRKVSAERSPAVVTWEAEARPVVTKSPKGRGSGTPPPSAGAIVSEKKSWPEPLKNKRLKSIAERVCEECGLTLKYVAKENPIVPHVARYNETGFHLIERFARRFALTVRANAGVLTVLAGQAVRDATPPVRVTIQASSVKKLGSSEAVAPSVLRSARFDPRSDSPVKHSAGDGDGGEIDVDFDADNAVALYAEFTAAASSAVVDIIPQSGIVAGSIVDVPGLGLREVMEMRYNRTGDSESMSLTVRPV